MSTMADCNDAMIEIQRAGGNGNGLHKRRITIPHGLKKLLEEMSREILRHNPENIPLFLADYLDGCLAKRKADCLSHGGIEYYNECITEKGEHIEYLGGGVTGSKSSPDMTSKLPADATYSEQNLSQMAYDSNIADGKKPPGWATSPGYLSKDGYDQQNADTTGYTNTSGQHQPGWVHGSGYESSNGLEMDGGGGTRADQAQMDSMNGTGGGQAGWGPGSEYMTNNGFEMHGSGTTGSENGGGQTQAENNLPGDGYMTKDGFRMHGEGTGGYTNNGGQSQAGYGIPGSGYMTTDGSRQGAGTTDFENGVGQNQPGWASGSGYLTNEGLGMQGVDETGYGNRTGQYQAGFDTSGPGYGANNDFEMGGSGTDQGRSRITTGDGTGGPQSKWVPGSGNASNGGNEMEGIGAARSTSSIFGQTQPRWTDGFEMEGADGDVNNLLFPENDMEFNPVQGIGDWVGAVRDFMSNQIHIIRQLIAGEIPLAEARGQIILLSVSFVIGIVVGYAVAKSLGVFDNSESREPQFMQASFLPNPFIGQEDIWRILNDLGIYND